METQKPSKAKSALNFGALLGLVLMVFTLITFVFELYETAQWISYLGYAIFAVGLYMGIKKYRDQELGGHITYGSSLGYGTLVGLFSGILVAFITYIYIKFVDDGMIQFAMEEQQRGFYESGMDDEQIEQIMENSAKMMTPAVFGIGSVIGYTFFGFIFSLILSAFLKKEPDNFEDTV